jgi:hypothetical protein
LCSNRYVTGEQQDVLLMDVQMGVGFEVGERPGG